MTRQDVIQKTSQKTGLDPLTSRLILESFYEVVIKSLSEGEPIYIRTFGSFILKQRAFKLARHIKQNTAFLIAPHQVPFFKPSREFTDQVRAREIPVAAKKANQ